MWDTRGEATCLGASATLPPPQDQPHDTDSNQHERQRPSRPRIGHGAVTSRTARHARRRIIGIGIADALAVETALAGQAGVVTGAAVVEIGTEIDTLVTTARSTVAAEALPA